MEFIKRVIIDTILFIALAGLFSRTGMFYVNSVGTALLASAVLAVLNVLVKPSLPINVLTLGLFSIVINALMLQLTSSFVGSFYFHFSSFGSAMLIAIVMSICNVIISDHINN